MNLANKTLIVATVLLSVSAASAQFGVNIDQYRATETAEDGFATSRPNDRGDGNIGFTLFVDYASNPLVVEDDLGDLESENQAIVADLLNVQLGFNIGLIDRLVLFAGLPINVVMSGEERAGVPTAEGGGLGDLRLGGRFRLVGENHEAFSLALQLTANVPLADLFDSEQSYLGDDGFGVSPELLMEVRGGPFRLTANVGVLIRPEATLRNLTVGNELSFSVGANFAALTEQRVCYEREDLERVRAMRDAGQLGEEWDDFDFDAECGADYDRLTVHGEIFGATGLSEFGTRAHTPIESLLGIKYRTGGGLTFGVAGGVGLTRGYGTPNFRVIGMFGLGTPDDPPPPPLPAIQTIVEGPGDADGDGITDDVDQCPDQPEDMDGFEDENGCPDPDNDGDGILDADDQCPIQAEDMDGDADEDGCPEDAADQDGDGIPDATDECPTEPEDVDTFEDENGCPDPDNDQDTVPDATDECPLAPGEPSNNGCPQDIRVDQAIGQIVVLERIEFDYNRARVRRGARSTLNEVKATLAANPQLARIRIMGHTDIQGRPVYNLDLSKRRARNVVRWLVQNGIDASRLEAWGCGEAVLRSDQETRAAHQENRRVEFHIIEPAPPSGVVSTDQCEQLGINED